MTDELSNTFLSNTFQRYIQLVKLLPTKPSDSDLLILYGFYKQATVGNCNTAKPNAIFDMKSYRKWNAWKSAENIDKDESMRNYIVKVNDLMNLHK